MHTNLALSSENVRCPRCGYDKRGVMAQWREQCPLRGICTECGLEFEWVEVFRPALFAPEWCIEFAPRRRSLSAACRTFMRSFWPWGFWSRIAMRHRVRPARLALYIGVLLLVLTLPYVGVQTSIALYVRHQVRFELPTFPQAAAAQLQAFRAWRTSPQNLQMMQAVKERLPEEYDLLVQSHDAHERALQREANAEPTTLRLSILRAVFEAVFTPTSGQSQGVTIDGFGRTIPYIPPSGLHRAADAYASGMSRSTGQRLNSGNRFIAALLTIPTKGVELVPILIALFAVLLIFPATLVLLPVSRRRAKIRWRHIARALVYSLFIPVTFWWLSIVCITLQAAYSAPPDLIVLGLPIAGMPLFIVIWWWAVIGRYLRVRHALVTSVLLFIVSGLIVGAGVYWGNEVLYGLTW